MDRSGAKPLTGPWRLSVWALGYAFRRWPGLIAALSTMLVGIGLDVLKPWPMKFLVDHALMGKPMSPALDRTVQALPGPATQENFVLWYVAATIVLMLLRWALGVVNSFASIGFNQRMTYDLASDLFGHLQRLSLRYHARKAVGDSIRRVTSDCGCVSKIVKDALMPVLSSITRLVTMFAIMWRMDAGLTLLSLTVVPYMLVVFHRYADAMEKRSYLQGEVEGQQAALVEQTLSSIPVVQAFGREEDGDKRFRESSRSVLGAAVAATSVALQFKVLMGFATAAGSALILWLGAHRVLDGHLTIGSMIVFLSYLASLYTPIEALIYTPSTIQSLAGRARRVLEVLETEHEVRDRPNAVPLREAKGDVRFENVTFGYEPDRPVLRNVSLHARPGETVAIVGATGAGKSTLVSLIPRFFDPWEGGILIDGRDVRDIQLKSLRSQVSLVLQESFLFPMSIAENIAYGQPDATREEIEAAAQAANAHAFITRLPEGYDTPVGERGGTLSGGERQRVAIARALLKDAPILILDEPTSALDAETEALLLEALERLMAGRTTFIIAHRLSTIRNADRVAVLKNGEVAEIGTQAELIDRGGVYRRLHELQFGGVPAGVAL